MRENEIHKIKMMEVRKTIAENLSSRGEIGFAAIVCVCRSFGETRMNWQKDNASWKIRLGFQQVLTDKEGRPFDIKQKQIELNSSITMMKEYEIQQIAVDYLNQFWCELIADTDTIPKLCLLWANEIAELSETLPQEESNGFNPRLWSDRVLMDYESATVLRSIKEQGDPNAIVGTLYGDIDVTLSDKSVMDIVSRKYKGRAKYG